jgi:radical SAM superfamily enzyme YgiQ (UPF0313 family)
MNVLLVYPHFPESYWSFSHALWLESKKSAFPPLGLLTVAAMLPKEWERRLVDMNVRPLRDSDISWADVVFVSAMRIQDDSMTKVIRRCKQMGKRVVVGGPYVSATPEKAPDADHVFVGECEEIFPAFVRDLESGNLRRIYQADEKPSMTSSPIPEFHLAQRNQYLAMSLQYSRGCPFRCEFCDIIELYGRVPRTKTNEQVMAELDAIYATGWRGLVFLVDDNFIGNKRNVRLLLPELTAWSEKHDWPFSFVTEASINLADDEELLAEMQRAGFHRVFIGIETPDEASLKEAQKGQNTKRNMLDGIRVIQSYGMEVMGGFIVGFDNDKEDIFDKQISFIRSGAIPLAMVGILTAAPHTQLWRRLQKEGRLRDGFTGNNTDGSLNFIPRMDPDRLVEGYRRVLGTLYDADEYYQRALNSLERVGEGSIEKYPGDVFRALGTLGRVLLTLGVRDRDRGAFWRYMGQVAWRRPDRLPHALVLASLGYHFRKYTDQVLENGTSACVAMEPRVVEPEAERIGA